MNLTKAISLPLAAVIILLTSSFSSPLSDIDCPSCPRVFADGSASHREVTRNSTLKAPAQNYATVQRFARTGKLVRIRSGEGYLVAGMTHSYPYLTPRSATFLTALGAAYKKACLKQGVPYRPFILTSALRTRQTVSSLMKVNGNAVRESSHLYGTTFDISWAHFGNARRPSQKNLNVLVRVLESFRNDNACLVKYEKQQTCFHITVKEGSPVQDEEPGTPGEPEPVAPYPASK